MEEAEEADRSIVQYERSFGVYARKLQGSHFEFEGIASANGNAYHCIGILFQQSDSGKEFEAKPMFQRFTADLMALCGFGFHLNALADPEVAFYKNVHSV
jgi:hypothetical protein